MDQRQWTKAASDHPMPLAPFSKEARFPALKLPEVRLCISSNRQMRVDSIGNRHPLKEGTTIKHPRTIINLIHKHIIMDSTAVHHLILSINNILIKVFMVKVILLPKAMVKATVNCLLKVRLIWM